MQSARTALVLLYDIRGFTAASKRLHTVDLGAFASAAHRVVLDEFTQPAPTFVKNLGDGHLLLWETSDPPDHALLRSVVEGAERARAAFTAFVVGQGEAGAGLPRCVGIGVAHGEVARHDDYYGMTLNLAARLQNLARPEGVALDTRVFEAVVARDERLREGFRRARVRLKGLGSTTVFVRRPFSLARALAPLAKVAAILALPLVYLALADAGAGVPGGEALRARLDSVPFSLFRTPRPRAQVLEVARRVRDRLAAALDRVRHPDGWFGSDFAHVPPEAFDVWSSSQSLTARLRDPGASPEALRTAFDGVAATFRDPGPAIRSADGTIFGWPPHPGFLYTEAEPLFWTLAAVSSALGRPGVVPEARRAEALALLEVVQTAADRHRPLEDGGWNMFANQKFPTGHSPYTTTLAFLAMLELRSAGLPWHGSVERRDAMLRATAAWFANERVEAGAASGWRRTQDPLDVVSPGLTLQVYALLLRAEAEAGVAVPEAILSRIPSRIEALVGQSLDALAADAGEFSVPFADHEGRPAVGKESINFLWHPWAVEAAQRWLARAERLGAPTRDRVRVERALGYLVVDLEEAALRAALAGYVFVASETLYAFSALPAP